MTQTEISAFRRIPADQGQYATERKLAINILERDSSRLREVRGALDRVHPQAFGVCADCETRQAPTRCRAGMGTVAFPNAA